MSKFWDLDSAAFNAASSAAVLEASVQARKTLANAPESLAESLPAKREELPPFIVLESVAASLPPLGGTSTHSPSRVLISPRSPPPGEVALIPFDMRGPSPREQLERARELARVEEGAVMRAAELVADTLRKRGWGGNHASVAAAAAAGSAEGVFAQLAQKDLKLAAAFEGFLGEQVATALAVARRNRNTAIIATARGRGGGGRGSPRGDSGPEAFPLTAGEAGGAPASGDEETEVLRGFDISALVDKFVVRLYYGLSRALMRSTAAGRAPSPTRGGGSPSPSSSAAAPPVPALAFSPFAGAIAAEALLPPPPPLLSTARVVAAPPLLLGQRFMRVAAVIHFRGTLAPPLQYENETALNLARSLQGSAFREPQPPPLVLAAATAQRLIAAYGVMPRAAALLQFAAVLRCRYEEVGGTLATMPGARPLHALGLPAAELAVLEGVSDAPAAAKPVAAEPSAENKEALERELEAALKVDVDELLATMSAKKKTRQAAEAAKKARLEQGFDFEAAKAEAKRFVKELVEKRKKEEERRA
jgi:hypothetical protein